MGRVCEHLIKMGEANYKQHLHLLITAAQRLAYGMELDDGKILSQGDRNMAIEDFNFIASNLFQTIKEMEDAMKLHYLNVFMRALENDRWVKNKRW